MSKNQKRTLIFRECPGCKTGAFVRKDGAGTHCRSCRAKENSQNNIGKYIDLTGKTFGRLTVFKIFEKKYKDKYYWKCICKCGKQALVEGSKLRSGHTKSCGCITLCAGGVSDTLVHVRWRAMLARCYNPKNRGYKNYGGRGITVCDSWRNDFWNFVNDMGEPKEGMTLDRVDNNGNYEPLNCRWVTMKEQNNNRRTNHKITAFGETLTLAQWSDRFKIDQVVLRRLIVEQKNLPEVAILKLTE